MNDGAKRERSAAWQRFCAHRLGLVGLMLLLLLALPALTAPLLPLADPHATDLSRRMAPAGSPGHPLGTDQLGRDLLARLVWGTRSSLAVGCFAVTVAALFGTAIGLLAAYFRAVLDALLMRMIDVLLAFPYLLLALAIVAALGPGLRNAMIAIAVVNIPFFARTVRGTALELSRRAFIDAARLGGAGHARILFRELLPNVLPVVVVTMSTNLGWMILETAGLSFLGLGAQPPAADLGGMLGNAREFLTTVPRVAVLPGFVILMLVVGVNLVGDGLRDLLDPRLKGKAAEPTRTTLAGKKAGTAQREREGDVLLRVEGLTTAFFQEKTIHRAVDALSFDLKRGERVAWIGESGSGKTVAALSLMGLVPHPGHIVKGRILFEGLDLVQIDEAVRRGLRGSRMAYIPQNPMTALNPVLSIGTQLVEALRAHQRLSGKAARNETADWLARVRIARPRERLRAYPHELSGGMRQRVLIAAALINDPVLIIADEPTTALDVTVQAEILKLLRDLCEAEGAALIFISHDLNVVRRLCNRALVLYAGRVVEEGGVDALLRDPAHPYTRGLLACAPALGQRKKPLQPIPGQAPQLDALPSGCHFKPRCDFAEDRCGINDVDLRFYGADRRVRCIRAEELDSWRP